MLTLLIKSTERGLLKQFDWNNFFYFLIKTDFSRFWLNILYQKIKNFEKWEKMSFDSIFELAIVILVGLEYLIVKIGRKFWFLQLFFLGYLFTTLLQMKMAKFRKKRLVFGSGYHNCCNFLHVTLQGTLHIYLYLDSLFGRIGLKTTLPDLSTFFS